MQRRRKTRIPKDGTLVKDVETGMPLRARRVTLEEFFLLKCTLTNTRFVQSTKILKSGHRLDMKRDCPYYVMHRDQEPPRTNTLEYTLHWSINPPKELACYVEEITARLKALANDLGIPSGKTVSSVCVIIADSMHCGKKSIFQNKLSGCIPRARLVYECQSVPPLCLPQQIDAVNPRMQLG